MIQETQQKDRGRRIVAALNMIWGHTDAIFKQMLKATLLTIWTTVRHTKTRKCAVN